MWRDSQFGGDYSSQGIQWPSTAFLGDFTNPLLPELDYRAPHNARCSPNAIESQTKHQYVDPAYEKPGFVPGIHQYQIPMAEMQSDTNSPSDNMFSNGDQPNDSPSQFLERTEMFSPTGSSEWTSSDYSESWQSQPARGPYTPIPSPSESFWCVQTPKNLSNRVHCVEIFLVPRPLTLKIGSNSKLQ